MIKKQKNIYESVQVSSQHMRGLTFSESQNGIKRRVIDVDFSF